jgi:hypothetical protein
MYFTNTVGLYSFTNTDVYTWTYVSSTVGSALRQLSDIPLNPIVECYTLTTTISQNSVCVVPGERFYQSNIFGVTDKHRNTPELCS